MSGKELLYIAIGVAIGYLAVPMLLSALHLTGSGKH